MNSEFRRPQLQNPMNVTLLKALVGLVPTSILFSYSAVLFLWRKTADSLLQLLGAACLVIVVLTHVAEALRWLPWMGWGSPNSVGHYLDLYSAVLGLTLFLIGYLLRNRPIEIGQRDDEGPSADVQRLRHALETIRAYSPKVTHRGGGNLIWRQR